VLRKISSKNVKRTKIIQPACSYRQFPSDFFDEHSRKSSVSYTNKKTQHQQYTHAVRGKRHENRSLSDMRGKKLAVIPKLQFHIVNPQVKLSNKEALKPDQHLMKKRMTPSSSKSQIFPYSRNQTLDNNYSGVSLPDWRPFTDKRSKRDQDCKFYFLISVIGSSLVGIIKWR
jgi:hypothetical protein